VVLGLSVPKLTMRAAALFASAVVALAGLLLVAFPAMDQPWLDALEDIAPPVQTAFLSSGERFTRNEVLDSIARARAELLRLRALEQDVRWGKIEMEPDKAERLRQYLAGRSEISAGDQLVLRHLRGKGRASAPRAGFASANHWLWRDLCRSARKAAWHYIDQRSRRWCGSTSVPSVAENQN
jgi:hypothetical protein